MQERKRKRFRQRYREIDRERHRLVNEDTPNLPDQCRNLEGLVQNVLRQSGIERDLWDRRLMEEWPALVGTQIARNARPGRVEGGTLFVYVTSSVWLNELSRYGKDQILASIQERFGHQRVRSIRLLLDPDLNAGPKRS